MAKIPAYLSGKVAVNDGTGIGYAWIDAVTSDVGTAFDAHLADLCNILRRTKTADGQGGFTVVWAASETNVPCQFFWGNNAKMFPTPKDVLMGGKTQTSQLWSLIMAVSHDVQVDDRIQGVHNDYLYEVIDTSGGETFPTVLNVLLRRLGPQ